MFFQPKRTGFPFLLKNTQVLTYSTCFGMLLSRKQLIIQLCTEHENIFIGGTVGLYIRALYWVKLRVTLQ